MTPTRREFLERAGQVAAAGLLLPLVGCDDQEAAPDGEPVDGGRPGEGAAGDGGLRPVSMAMHVHASFSEGVGSMEAQLDQAAQNRVEVLWWTEHDWRMAAHRYRREVHFDAMEEQEDDSVLAWAGTAEGDLSQAEGGIVADPASPLDPRPPGALRVAATAGGEAFAAQRFRADTTGSRSNLRTSLAEQVVRIEVHPRSVGPDAYLEVEVATSRRPRRQDRPGGIYKLSYRVGGPGRAGEREADGTTGIVTLAAEPGRWTSLELRPAEDLSAVWPGLDGRDAGFFDLTLSAYSRRGAPAEGFFDFLRFERPAALGERPFAVQGDLMASYASAFPSVTQHAGLEVSIISPHFNWFGGDVTMPDLGGLPLRPQDDPELSRRYVKAIQAAGGLASLNHPFGTPALDELAEAEQEAARRRVAAELVRERLYGAEVLEVGYRSRAGVTLERHLAVWDACSRNGLFVTGTGVSDNHNGNAWSEENWNFLTWAWARGPAEDDLVAAVGAGRAYFGDMARFSGTLDLVVDGACPMGSVSVSGASSRRLTVVATDVPAGGRVRLVQGRVDYAGPDAAGPDVRTTDLAASRFATGRTEVDVDTAASAFVRAEVADAAGVVVALSNPVWVLREDPPLGVPDSRAC